MTLFLNSLPFIRNAAFFLLILFPAASLSATSYYGKNIAAVEFQTSSSIPTDNLPGIVFVKKGDAYSTANLRKSIRYLYLTGLFSQVTAYGRERDDGVALTFHLKPQQWVYEIKIKGNKAVPDDEIRPLLPLKRGGEFSPEVLKEAEEKVKDIYEKRGYFNVDVSTGIETEGHAVLVRITVSERHFCRVSEIRFEGEPLLGRKKLLRVMESKEGKPLSRIALEKDSKKLIKRYHEENYLEAELSEPVISFGPERESAVVAFTVKTGPKYRITFVNNRHFSNKKLLKIVRPEAVVVAPSSISERWRRLITRAYTSEGFPFAKVTAEEEQSKGEKIITFRINEGKRFHTGEIGILGNKMFSRKKLLSLMESAKGFFSKPYSEDRLKEDIGRLRRFYEIKGYSAAKINYETIFPESDDKANILITISEGPKRIIETIEFKGNSTFVKKDLLQMANLQEGTPFNSSAPEEAKATLLKAYSSRGYLYVKITAETLLSTDGEKAEIIFSIEEGPEVRTGKIILKGNRKTKDRIITRELTLKSGQIYDTEKALQDRHRLNRMGLFRGVDYSQIDPDKKEGVKDILIKVNERKPGSVAVGLGYATDVKLRGFVDVSYKNIGGTARTVRLRGEASEIDRKILLGYREPWLLGFRVDGRINLLYQLHEADSYDIRKEGIVFGLDRKLSDYSRLSLQYNLEKNRYSNVQPGAGQTAGDNRLASIGPLLIRDSRDDPFNPGRGSVNIVRYEIADDAIASDEEFRKATLQSGWYYRIFPRLTGALSLRLGNIDLVGDSVEVPIDKRFFLGGRTTVRGYREDSIGPKTALGTAIGGEKMVNLNVEARIRIIGNFGGLLFYDAGNVWLESEHVKLSELRKSVGLGLSYLTPIGPLSLEYGSKLERKPGESSGEWYFTIGNIF